MGAEAELLAEGPIRLAVGDLLALLRLLHVHCRAQRAPRLPPSLELKNAARRRVPTLSGGPQSLTTG